MPELAYSTSQDVLHLDVSKVMLGEFIYAKHGLRKVRSWKFNAVAR